MQDGVDYALSDATQVQAEAKDALARAEQLLAEQLLNEHKEPAVPESLVTRPPGGAPWRQLTTP